MSEGQTRQHTNTETFQEGEQIFTISSETEARDAHIDSVELNQPVPISIQRMRLLKESAILGGTMLLIAPPIVSLFLQNYEIAQSFMHIENPWCKMAVATNLTSAQAISTLIVPIIHLEALMTGKSNALMQRVTQSHSPMNNTFSSRAKKAGLTLTLAFFHLAPQAFLFNLTLNTKVFSSTFVITNDILSAAIIALLESTAHIDHVDSHWNIWQNWKQLPTWKQVVMLGVALTHPLLHNLSEVLAIVSYSKDPEYGTLLSSTLISFTALAILAELPANINEGMAHGGQAAVAFLDRVRGDHNHGESQDLLPDRLPINENTDYGTASNPSDEQPGRFQRLFNRLCNRENQDPTSSSADYGPTV